MNSEEPVVCMTCGNRGTRYTVEGWVSISRTSLAPCQDFCSLRCANKLFEDGFQEYCPGDINPGDVFQVKEKHNDRINPHHFMAVKIDVDDVYFVVVFPWKSKYLVSLRGMSTHKTYRMIRRVSDVEYDMQTKAATILKYGM